MVKLEYSYNPREKSKYQHTFYLYRDSQYTEYTAWWTWVWFGLGAILGLKRKFLLYPWEKTWDKEEVVLLGEWLEVHSAIKVADWISRKIKRKLK